MEIEVLTDIYSGFNPGSNCGTRSYSEIGLPMDVNAFTVDLRQWTYSLVERLPFLRLWNWTLSWSIQELTRYNCLIESHASLEVKEWFVLIIAWRISWEIIAWIHERTTESSWIHCWNEEFWIEVPSSRNIVGSRQEKLLSIKP